MKSWLTLSDRKCITQPKVFKYKLDRLLLASYRKEFQVFTTWVYDSARNRERIGDDLKQKDIFHALKSTKDPKTGEGFTMKEIWVECALLLAAGERPSDRNSRMTIAA